ncbi:MAG: N-acetylmuramoyl-L-alanine amidase [Prevotella sp.]|nr:N-acetylmuramoyl-L-alanine amidase [Prevotella sp.]
MSLKNLYFTLLATFMVASAMALQMCLPEKNRYPEVSYPTPNIEPDTRNEVLGVVLHHTAEPTAERSLEILSSPKRKASTHVVIDYDGTRYVMAPPDSVTWHAGKSVLNGREACNFFTVGIEFQGNTVERPLTSDQVDSAIEYLKPIIKKYGIPLENIVTHEMVRKAYKRLHPDERVYDKCDITPAEYQRFMDALREAL